MNNRIEIREDKNLGYRVFAFVFAFILLLFIVHSIIGFLASAIAGYYGTDLKLNLELYTVYSWGALICSIFLCSLFLYSEKRIGKLHFMGFTRIRSKESFMLLFGMLTIVLYCGVSLLYHRLLGDVSINEDKPNNVLLLLLFGILSGCSEELIFRGYLLQSFLKQNKKYSGVFVTSAVFALMHILSPEINVLLVVSIFFIGCLLSIVTIYSRSIYFALSFHVSFNVIGSYLGLIDVFDEAEHSILLINRESEIGNIWFGNRVEMIDSLILICLVFLSIIFTILLMRNTGISGQAKIN